MAYKSASLNVAIPRVGSGEGGNAATPPEGDSAAVYVYRSPDPIATVIAAAYIDDGADKGLQVNDIVLVVDDNIPTVDVCLVTVVDVSTNPAGDVTMINGT